MSGGGLKLGSIGNALGDVVGGALKPVNLAGSAIGSVGGVGSVLGPALQLAGGANPLGVFGSTLAGEVLKGYTEKGGSADKPLFIDAAGNPIYADRGYNYGANTYKIGSSPLDASKYFVSGDKGVYNILPMLGGLYGDSGVASRTGTSSYNLYNDIYSKMADDAAAQKAFSERFGVKEVDPRSFMSQGQRTAYTKGYVPQLAGFANYDVPRLGINMGRGGFDMSSLANFRPRGANTTNPLMQSRIFGGSIFDPISMVTGRTRLPQYLAGDLNQAFLEYNPSDKFMTTLSGMRNFKAPTINPIKYVDFGFGEKASMKEPWEAVANYASQNKNPFFLAYAPQTPTPAPAPAAPQPSPTGMRAGGLVALAKKR